MVAAGGRGARPRRHAGSPTWPSGPPRGSAPSTSPRTAGWPTRRRPRTRWPSSSTCSPPSSASTPAALLAEQVLKDGFHIATGFLGTPLVTDALTNAGELSTGLRAAAAAGEPVVALPGDDGRDDDLGALGLDAPGRLDQPRRDDVVQPLRVRRGGRLAAPHGRRSRRRRRRATGRLRIAPRPGPGITSAAATHETPYGTAAVVVDALDGTAFALEVTVPPNTTAEVVAARRQRAGRGRLRPALLHRDDRGAGAGREAGLVLQPGRPRSDDDSGAGRPAAAVRPRVRRRPRRRCRRSRR